jgi:hypothetical protein
MKEGTMSTSTWKRESSHEVIDRFAFGEAPHHMTTEDGAQQLALLLQVICKELAALRADVHGTAVPAGPSAFAVSIAGQLGSVLRSIHANYADQVAPAISAAIDRRDFDRARHLCTDSEYIANEVERILEAAGFSPRGQFSDGLGAVVMELIGTGPVDSVLEDIDPERHANDEQMIARLRESGNWTDDDQAKHQADMAERAAGYPQTHP